MSAWLLVITMNFSYACDRLSIACEALCKADGDDSFMVKGKECFCANKKDLSKITLKLNKSVGWTQKERPLYYER